MNIEQNTKHAPRAKQVERQEEKKTGRAAARRNAPKLPHAIRVGPNKGAQKILGLYTGDLSIFFPSIPLFLSLTDKPLESMKKN